jgi:hypothetical protein
MHTQSHRVTTAHLTTAVNDHPPEAWRVCQMTNASQMRDAFGIAPKDFEETSGLSIPTLPFICN